MKAQDSVYLYAWLMIQKTEPFDVFVKRLTALMLGFSFKEEDSGRYEEIPAYQAISGDMQILLLGIPPEDESFDDEYRLEFNCKTNASLEHLFQSPGGEFIRKFATPKSPNSRGAIEYSQELADYLTSCGIEGCRPIIFGG